MLGALADGTGFPASEIERFDAEQLSFWWNCVMEWRKYAASLED